MLLEINLTMIVFALSFLVFIYLLDLTLFKPVGKIIDVRRSIIEGSHIKAKEVGEEINNILLSYKARIKETRSEAKNIVDRVSNEAKNKKYEALSQLISSLNKEKEAAIKRIKDEQKVKENELKGKIIELRDLITSKILGVNNKLEETLAGTH